MKFRVFTFRCPVCSKRFVTDEGAGEPVCSGPSEIRDDHELTIMHLLRVDEREIHPAVGAARAAGPLIIQAR
jgi:hypothetical protein